MNMDQNPTIAASEKASGAAACGRYAAALCSTTNDGRLFEMPKDYFAVYAVRGKGKRAKSSFLCNVLARGKADAIKVARGIGLDLPRSSYALYLGVEGYRDSLSRAFPRLNPSCLGTGHLVAGTQHNIVGRPDDLTKNGQ